MELEPEPEPYLFKSRNRNRNHNFFKSRNRNHNFSKVGIGTGTVKNSYGSTTLILALCAPALPGAERPCSGSPFSQLRCFFQYGSENASTLAWVQSSWRKIHILFYSILFYSILFYSFLFYSILLYSILFYSILFYITASAYFGGIFIPFLP